jgi:hypothetical protein
MPEAASEPGANTTRMTMADNDEFPQVLNQLRSDGNEVGKILRELNPDFDSVCEQLADEDKQHIIKTVNDGGDAAQQADELKVLFVELKEPDFEEDCVNALLTFVSDTSSLDGMWADVGSPLWDEYRAVAAEMGDAGLAEEEMPGASNELAFAIRQAFFEALQEELAKPDEWENVEQQ